MRASTTCLAALALVLAVGCQTDDDSFEGQAVTITVKSAEPLDQVVWYQGRYWVADKPRTPRMIAAGVPAPAGFAYKRVTRTKALAPGAHDAELEDADAFGLDIGQTLLLGYRRDAGGQLVLVSAASTKISFATGSEQFLTMELEADFVPEVEIWGAKKCATADDLFYIDTDDVDCDGVPKQRDCNDALYCDPTAPGAVCTCT